MGSILFKSEPVIKDFAQDTPGDETDESYNAAELGLDAQAAPPTESIISASNAALSPAARSLVPTPVSAEAPDA